MASTYLWHQFHLYRCKIIICSIFLFLGVNLLGSAQHIVRQNLPGHDYKRMHYGLFLAINASRFQLQHSPYYINQQKDSLLVNPRFGPGFMGGFVINRRLTDFIDARFVPGVSFYSRSVVFNSNNKETTQEMPSIAMEFPVQFKFKSLRRGNVRMYFVGGVKGTTDFGNKRKENFANELAFSNQDVAVEYGVGLELFYPYFKFAPELRFSNGLINRYSANQSPFSLSTQSLRSNTITLYFNFEN